MEFNQMILTQNGRTLMAKAVSGQATIKFTKMRTSSSQYQLSQLEMLTSLSNIKQTSDVETFKSNGVTAKVLAAFDNYNLAVGYDVRTVGLYALDPDAGEILYAVSTASVSGYMPPNNGTSATGLNITIYTEVGNADNVNMVVDPAGFATKAELRALEIHVAYADDLTGGGFSKTDNTKLYKGYGVKNSNLATDYQWERNVEDLSTGGDNLIINGGFPTGTRGWWKTTNITFKIATHPFYYNNNKKIFVIDSTSQSQESVGSTRFKVKRNTNYTISFVGFASSNVKDANVYFLGKQNDESSDWKIAKTIFANHKMSSTSATTYKMTFNTGDSDEGYIRFDHNGSTDGQLASMFVGEVVLVEGNVAKKYQPSSADLMFNSNPINSILTTLSQENPSTTLGGTWKQLGTESKFSQTIYYWQRTE